MPYHFEFDRKNRILLIVVSGEYTDEEQLTINTDIRKHAMALKPAAGIGDMSAITVCSVTPQSVQIAVRESSPYEAGVARFLVAPADHVFGMSRMYQMTAKEKSRASMRIVREGGGAGGAGRHRCVIRAGVPGDDGGEVGRGGTDMVYRLSFPA